MSTQDAQDIVQMNSLASEIPVTSGGKKKSSLMWIVLGCVVVGVGLGVFVYQQSLSPAPKPSATPKASRAPASVAPLASPAKPATNEVGPASNTMTFPKKGKLRVFHNFNNIAAVAQLTINGTKKQITLPAKPSNATTFMNYADSSFEVEAGSSGTLELFLNSTNGPKLLGWINPFDAQKKECGIQGGSTANNEEHLAYATKLLAGETFFAYQCWEDDDNPGEYNDVYMIWTYAPGTATVSPSPVASTTTVSPSPAASTKASASPSPSPSASAKASAAASPSPSPSVKASTAATVSSPTPTPSTRAAMPDTSEGVPVTGVFEITVGTVSVGLLLLALGLFGLLSL